MIVQFVEGLTFKVESLLACAHQAKASQVRVLYYISRGGRRERRKTLIV